MVTQAPPQQSPPQQQASPAPLAGTGMEKLFPAGRATSRCSPPPPLTGHPNSAGTTGQAGARWAVDAGRGAGVAALIHILCDVCF